MAAGTGKGTGHLRLGGRWRILVYRLIAIALLALLVAGAVYAARMLFRRRRQPPELLSSGRVTPGSLLVPGATSALTFSRMPDGVYVARADAGNGQTGMRTAPEGLIGCGQGIVCVSDAGAGTVKVFTVDSPGLAPSATLKAPGVTMAASDKKNTLVVLGKEPAGRGGFKVRLLDQRGRAAFEREIPDRSPLSIRAWPGGVFVVTVLEAKEYPSTSILIASDKGTAETKGMPGLARCSSAGVTGGLAVVGCSDSLYAYDLGGQLKWCVEPGGSPVDAAVTSDGVAVGAAKPARSRVERLFVRDFVAMYDVRGIRLWKADVKPGVSCVRGFDGGIVAGTASGITALSPAGKILWDINLPSPVTGLEISTGGDRLFVTTEAGEFSSYGLK